jgi:hypothetical protein
MSVSVMKSKSLVGMCELSVGSGGSSILKLSGY